MNSTTSMTSSTQNQISNILKDNSYEEPNIKKAKFILSPNRTYTLEFDHNLEMQELKMMIQKAAHLKKNTFSIYKEGEDFTQYTDETFDSLFPDETLVVFTLELNKGEENFDETELLLQINMPCPEHDYKFLLYFCFDCGKSICSDCFTNGAHKGHKIQDKCFYLLPSKYLVKKMFENWSKKPYEDFQISQNLEDFKNNLNNVTFKQLFEMLKQVQTKCNDLIDNYNLINQKSLCNIRDSVRDIQTSCIKALDEYKDLINIKDIVNNQEVFIDFDKTYKEMGNKQEEKFKENLLKFQELNKSVSILVENLIKDVCKNINDVLVKAKDDKQYKDVEQNINLKLIQPVNKDDIINQISEKKKYIKINKKNNRKTTINNNYNKLVNNISDGVEQEFKKESSKKNNNKGRNTMVPDNFASKMAFGNNNNENDLNASNGKSDDLLNNDIHINNMNMNNVFNKNYSIDSTLQKPEDNNMNNDNDDNNNQILNNSNPDNNDQNDIDMFNIEYDDNNNINLNQKTESINSFDNNIQNKNEKESNEEKPSQNPFGSILDMTKSNSNNDNRQNMFNTASNKKNNNMNIPSINQLSPMYDNTGFNGYSNTSQQQKILNMNNYQDSDNIQRNPFLTDNNDNNNNNINDNNKQQKPMFTNIMSQNSNNNYLSPFSNMIENNNKNNNDKNIFPMDNKYLAGLAKNCRTILEEANESESELKSCRKKEEKNVKIEYYLNKPYILCPIPTTNKIKIITNEEADDHIFSLNFPKILKISRFLFNCAHCNHDKKLFISGGIPNIASNLSSNIFLMIDFNNKNNDSYITELCPMIYSRSGHSMIGYNNTIYAVGGENTNKVEKYDIINDKWIEVSPMIKKKSYAMLTIDNGYLYSFFGKEENGNYPDCIERLNLESNNSSWEMILFSNPNNIDTRRYGCGLYHVDELIYFIGGKCNEEVTDEIFFFNLSERRIDKTDSKLKWKESFRENTLFQLGNKIVQISDQKFFGIYLTIKVQ